MSAFYSGLQSTAARLLGEKGRALTLRKRTPGAYNAATGSVTQAAADHAAVGVVKDFPALLIDGTRIQAGDKQVLMSAAGLQVQPDTGDQLLIGGATFAVVSVQAVEPADVVVIYKLQVRR